jgi:hypothetical protein
MPDDSSDVRRRARSASADELKALVHEADDQIPLGLLENPNFEEAHLTILLDRLDISASVLSAVAAEGKWTSNEAVRLRLVRHPHTPHRIALSLLQQLYLFDLVQVSLMPSTPADIRRVAEEILVARVPHLPVGQKLTLARRGPSRVAGALLAEGHAQAVKLALANAFLAESQVLKVLANPGVQARVVAAIAQHPKWSSQYNVRAALVRNQHTPVPVVLAFLPNLTLRDLKEIAAVEGLSPHLRKYIQKELVRRAGAESEREE